MLFTDRLFVTIDDLPSIDSEVVDVAATENIPTSGPGSFIESAIEECGGELLSMFQNPAYNWNAASQIGQEGFFPGLGYDSTPPPRITLGQVCVDSVTTTYASPIVRYCRFLALRKFYQIVSGRKVDDRYQSKLIQIQSDLDNKYFPQLRGSGLPVVFSPIPCPGAAYELNTGTWGSSNVSEVATGSAGAATWDVAITWVSSDTSSNESGPSTTVTIPVASSHAINIDITSLIPPGAVPQVNFNTTGIPTIVSWRVYAGLTGTTMYLQATVPVTTLGYQFTGAPTITNTPVGRGQPQDTALVFINTFFRA